MSQQGKNDERITEKNTGHFQSRIEDLQRTRDHVRSGRVLPVYSGISGQIYTDEFVLTCLLNGNMIKMKREK